MLIDEVDKTLLARLRDNGRASIADLARALGLSRSTVKDRIDRLERRGVIKGYSLVLGDEVSKSLVRAHVMITLDSGHSAHIIRALRAMNEIRRAYAVSGIYDLIAVVEAESTGELDEVLDRVRELEGIKKTLTCVVLSTKFEK
jgi:DNA-binding Lrp family transcriptional regulator